ncbi:hypothetical protein A7K99_01590 [Tatumella citrea]|uniref:Uncharacterized protein n=1 Tax=Tatumella citrea TaxID=53336 RepID=A0A1Y0LFJ4_TATCI|nr:hypothetical protein A7K98_01595 [Tatumella citrea]ARU96637.1 hypothetical protein A7K99_01590 [Tatumella citrea]
MRSFAVIFLQPPFCDLPYFIQCSEQIKIQYFSPVCPVKSFNKSILSGFSRLNELQLYIMIFSPLGQCQ